MKHIYLLSSDVHFSRMLYLELSALHAETHLLPSTDVFKAHSGFHAAAAENEAREKLSETDTALFIIDLDSPLGDHSIDALLTSAKEKEKPVILFGSPATPLLSAEKYRYYDAEITRYVFVRPFLMEQFLYCAAQRLATDSADTSSHKIAATMKMKEHSPADDLILRSDTSTVYFKNERVTLTPTEFELLSLLMQHRGDVLSRDMILSSLSENGKAKRSKQASNLVDVYIRFLRQKLEVPHGIRFIESVRGIGYMIPLN